MLGSHSEISVERAVATPEVSHAATPDLRVHALGPFEAWVQGQGIDVWAYTRPRELLALLLCHPGGLSRSDIGSAMWPDAASAQTRNSFHVTLHHLRKTLGHADWITMENERYRISLAITVEFDVTLFERMARSANSVETLTTALGLYRDHFLADEPTGPWRDDVQDRLRRLYCEAGLRLGSLLEEAGDIVGAAERYEAVVAREPLHEEAHRRLLLCWARVGDRPRALRHYDRLMAVLQNELELEPEPETVEVYEQIKAGVRTRS